MDETALTQINDAPEAVSGKSSTVALSLVLCLYVAARLWRLTASCLWFDEIFSVHAARHEWGRMLGFVAADLIHPPLFYALLKLWMGAGGDSLLWLRLFPVVISVAAVVPFLLLARELKLRASETNLALLLAATNGYLIKYAQEVRMYSLLLFLALCSLWLFVRLFKRAGASRANSAALFAVNLLLVFTHYYGWLVVSAEALFLLFKARRKLKGFLLAVAALLLCFVPWIYAVLKAKDEGAGLAQNIGWAARPSAADVVQFLTLLHQPFYFRQSLNDPPYVRLSAPLALLVFGLPVALLAWNFLRRGARDAGTERANDARWLFAFFVFTVAFVFAASHLLPHSIWGTRHLIIVAAPYIIFASVALNRLRAAWLKTTLLIVLGCWLLLAATVSVVRREPVYIWCAWENLAAQMTADEAAAHQTPTVYAFEDLVAYHLWFASQTKAEPRFNVVVVKNIPGLKEDPAYFLPRRFDGVQSGDIGALEGEQFWVAFRDASWDETRPPLNILKAKGYRAEKVFDASAQGQHAFLVLLRRGS
ncbi:MAG TPA: glycosyltransferase family 39 protein [Pyrinomonadaceae bacterium]|nr:glycosyltransferase family 39 protein [Pyrinomonadaceae bacterium]